MNILEKYGLTFEKVRDQRWICRSEDISNSPLSGHLSDFNIHESEEAIEMIELEEQGQPYPNENVFNDSTEVTVNPPNAIIDEDTHNYEIPMADLKEIYKEWIDYLRKQGKKY